MDARYPDKGVSYETFTTDFMLEMEPLSPLTALEPDESLEHVEEWELIEGEAVPENDDNQIGLIVEKYINTTK